MTRRTKQILAVMLVATALCADRGLAAPLGRASTEAPASMTTHASGWIARLSRGLGRSVAVVLSRQDARQSRYALSVASRVAVALLEPVHATLTTFEFRLPPPVL